MSRGDTRPSPKQISHQKEDYRIFSRLRHPKGDIGATRKLHRQFESTTLWHCQHPVYGDVTWQSNNQTLTSRVDRWRSERQVMHAYHGTTSLPTRRRLDHVGRRHADARRADVDAYVRALDSFGLRWGASDAGRTRMSASKNNGGHSGWAPS